jgi:hypothetical protein
LASPHSLGGDAGGDPPSSSRSPAPAGFVVCGGDQRRKLGVAKETPQNPLYFGDGKLQ